MNEKTYHKQYWESIDRQNKQTLAWIRRYGLKDKLQEVFYHFSQIGTSGMLSSAEVARLHRHIDRWRYDHLNIALFRYQLQSLRNKKRIKAADALNAYIKAVYYQYYIKLDEINLTNLTTIAQDHYDLIAHGEKKRKYKPDWIIEYLEEMEDIYGIGYSDALYADAEYRTKRVQEAVVKTYNRGDQISSQGGIVTKEIDKGQRWLLNKTTRDYSGFIDKVAAYIACKAVIDAFHQLGIEEVIFIAVIDNGTTDSCLHLHRKKMKVEELVFGINAPPIADPPHPCRSVLMPTERNIAVPQSLGAKGKNYDIEDVKANQTFHFAEGTYIQNIEIFAGAGTRKPLHDGVAEGLTAQFGGEEKNWQHAKGYGIINVNGEEVKAEVHWFQEKSVGRVKFKVFW